MNSSVPADLYYTPSHEWVRQDPHDPKLIYIGITNHAQQHLGDIVYLSLPIIDKQVEAGEDCCVIESVKAASDIYSPLSGKITAINDALRAQPDLINQDPYAHWIFSVHTDITDGIKDLLNAEEYTALLNEANL